MNRGTIKQVKVEEKKVWIMVHLELNTKIGNTQYNIWVSEDSKSSLLTEENKTYEVSGFPESFLCALANGMKCEFDFDMKNCKITSITFLGPQNS